MHDSQNTITLELRTQPIQRKQQSWVLFHSMFKTVGPDAVCDKLWRVGRQRFSCVAFLTIRVNGRFLYLNSEAGLRRPFIFSNRILVWKSGGAFYSKKFYSKIISNILHNCSRPQLGNFGLILIHTKTVCRLWTAASLCVCSVPCHAHIVTNRRQWLYVSGNVSAYIQFVYKCISPPSLSHIVGLLELNRISLSNTTCMYMLRHAVSPPHYLLFYYILNIYTANVCVRRWWCTAWSKMVYDSGNEINK